MDFIFQKGTNPDDVISLRRRDSNSYTVVVKNTTEGYTSTSVLQDYEVKQYLEVLYLSALEDERPYEYVQMNFPNLPGLLRNLQSDRYEYSYLGYDFSFLDTFAYMITTSLQLEEWPTITSA